MTDFYRLSTARAAEPLGLSGVSGVAQAFRRAAVSQCHPKMLFAILLPFFIMVIGAIALTWLFWTPLTDWVRIQASHFDFVNTIDDWLVTAGLFSIKLYLAPLIAAAVLLPAAGVLGLAVAAIFVMPIVLRHVHARDYADVARLGKFAAPVSAWNAIWVLTLFSFGWIVTLPLWLLPPMALVLHVFWWTFAFTRIMRIDAIVEHASPTERRELLRRRSGGFWTVGLVCALINLLPPAWIVLPVFSALVFAHYGLSALQAERRKTAAIAVEPAI